VVAQDLLGAVPVALQEASSTAAAAGKGQQTGGM
jgi:hypothetical protein